MEQCAAFWLAENHGIDNTSRWLCGSDTVVEPDVKARLYKLVSSIPSLYF